MQLDLNPYKNIIFDLGDVVLNIDYNKAVEEFKKLGLDNFAEHFSQAKQKHLFDLYEKGQISSDEFRDTIKKEFKNTIINQQIDDAWNSLLLDLPKERLLLLKKIKNTHRTFLLSNTNEIHIIQFNKYLNQTYRINDLSDYFEKMYLSYEVGMRKPDAEIFELVLNQNKLIASETLFIDDSKQHIDSAQGLGINTYWLQKPETIMDIFE